MRTLEVYEDERDFNYIVYLREDDKIKGCTMQYCKTIEQALRFEILMGFLEIGNGHRYVKSYNELDYPELFI